MMDDCIQVESELLEVCAQVGVCQRGEGVINGEQYTDDTDRQGTEAVERYRSCLSLRAIEEEVART